MIIYGINYSEQIAKTKGVKIGCAKDLCSYCGPFTDVNNGKGKSICLSDEINETNSKLGKRYNQQVEQIEARISVPPKKTCQIM